MIISILNQKGGTGKTTIAVNIAREYTLRKVTTLLVDSDRQGTALKWHEKSTGKLIDLTCMPGKTLHTDVVKFNAMYNRIIIDGVPSISPVTGCAIKASDLILIPVQPSPYDIWSTEDLVKLVHERIEMTEGRTKAYFIVSRKIKNTKLAKDIEEELQMMGLPVFKNGTCQRISYPTTAAAGKTVVDQEEGALDAAKEIAAIVDEIEEVIDGLY